LITLIFTHVHGIGAAVKQEADPLNPTSPIAFEEHQAAGNAKETVKR